MMTAAVHVLMDPQDKQTLERVAKSLGMASGTLARMFILRALRETDGDPGQVFAPGQESPR